MTDEAVGQETVAQEANAAQDAAQTETDWQAKYEEMRGHSREWEKRAKENAAAATELEELKQAQLTEQEKANARAEKAESELAAIKAEQERLESARSVAEQTGTPVELLEFCKDQDAMEQFARIYTAKQRPVHAAGASRTTNVVKPGEGKASNADIFAQTAEKFFK